MSHADRRVLHRARRGLLLLGSVVAGAAMFTSCSSDSSAAADNATVLDLDLGQMVLEPTVLEAPAGDLVLRITNTDPNMVHDLVVYGKGTRRLAPGESQTLEIPAVPAGQYRMWCDVEGHAEAGMTGRLVVTQATAPATT
jgi:nitrite reductase (NO-forming)